MKYSITALLGLLCLLCAMQAPQVGDYSWPDKVYDSSSNPLSAEKIELGKKLFYDPQLSADGKISCASCHSPYNAFAHTDHALSHGIHDSIGRRNAPALMNLAWQPVFMWDGAIHHLDMQALFPLTHPAEMGETLPHILNKLKNFPAYTTAFKNAFGDDSLTGQHLLKALSAFMLSLESRNALYDKVKRKEAVFTAQEKSGETLFMQKCASCHPPPLFTDFSFRNNGIGADSLLRDAGRSRITKINSDSLCFKVPTLRNLSYTYPYMHDGRFKNIQQVLKHYAGLHQSAGFYSEKIKTIGAITDDQRVDLQAFLLTLNDESFIKNPGHRPSPLKKSP